MMSKWFMYGVCQICGRVVKKADGAAVPPARNLRGETRWRRRRRQEEERQRQRPILSLYMTYSMRRKESWARFPSAERGDSDYGRKLFFCGGGCLVNHPPLRFSTPFSRCVYGIFFVFYFLFFSIFFRFLSTPNLPTPMSLIGSGRPREEAERAW